VCGHEASLVEKLGHWLQSQSFCGVIFTKAPMPGTFSLQAGHIASETAPDIVFSLAWKADASTNGTAGMILCDAGYYGPGQGGHTTLSPFDMHNTCIAAGPDFRRGFADELPSGNMDIAPTILWLLGATPPAKLSGRVLHEALNELESPKLTPRSNELEASWRGEKFTWRQSLRTIELDGVTYFDEGSSSQTPL
jgi:hypothetical protein